MTILSNIMEISNEILKEIKITPLLDTLKLEKIDDDEYFSKKYSNYISNSRLGLLKSKGVKAFFEGIKSDGFNSSFEYGTNLHSLVLQPESFELIDCVFKPTAKAGLMADYLYKTYKDKLNITDDEIKSASYVIGYYKDKLTTNRLNEFRQKSETYWKNRYLFEDNLPESEKIRIYTDEKSVDLLKNCISKINEDVNIQNLLHPEGLTEDIYSANEKTILLDIQAEIPDYEPEVYHLKAKLDNFTVDKENNIITVNDLKSTSKLANEFDPLYYSYNREIASYSWLLRMCAKKYFNLDNPEIKGNFLVSSIIPEYNTLVYPMTPQLFKTGWKEYLYLLKTVIYYNIVKGYEF